MIDKNFKGINKINKILKIVLGIIIVFFIVFMAIKKASNPQEGSSDSGAINSQAQ